MRKFLEGNEQVDFEIASRDDKYLFVSGTLVPIYQKNISVIKEILKDKPPVDIGNLKNDKVFAAIKESLSMFKTKK